MKKFVSDEELYYKDFKQQMHSFWNRGSKEHNGYQDSIILENTYLYYHGDIQNSEHDRLCVLLPLIRTEIENNMLSEKLLEELEIYYADFNEGVLDDFLYENEYEEIKQDLYWCYQHKQNT